MQLNSTCAISSRPDKFQCIHPPKIQFNNEIELLLHFSQECIPAASAKKERASTFGIHILHTISPQVPKYCFTTQLISPLNAMPLLSVSHLQPRRHTWISTTNKMALGKSNYVFRIYMLYLILFVLPKILNINLNFNPIIYLSLSSSSSTSNMAWMMWTLSTSLSPNLSRYKTPTSKYQINSRTGNVSSGQISSLNLKLIGRLPRLRIVFWFPSPEKARQCTHTHKHIHHIEDIRWLQS